MARTALTLVKTTEGSTAATATQARQKISTGTNGGVYVKTGGTSNIDASRILFLVERSSKSTGTGYAYLISGSTAGNDDFEPGKYSTARNQTVSFTSSTGDTRNQRYFKIQDTARFLDTAGYMKMDFSTAFSTASGTTHACYITAIYLPRI